MGLTKPGRETLYLTHEAKAHQNSMTLGYTLATGSSNSTWPIKSFPVPLGAKRPRVQAIWDCAVVF